MFLFSNTSSQTWRCQVPRQRRAAPWPGVDNEGNGAVTFSLGPLSEQRSSKEGSLPWLMDERENHPDHWFRRVARGYWLEARTAAAEFVGADVDDVVFVSNATTAVNVVLRSLKLEAGDAILATTLTFRSFQTLWEDLQERIYPRGVQCLLMEIKMPILSEDQVVQQYDEFLASHPNVKFVLIDHITSPSTILMPVERLIPVCHKHGALVMIDGAHAPGQVKLKLNMLGADMYTGNFHKWLFTPRGCALLWVSKDHHHLVNPVNTPWRKKQSLGDQFFYQGTQDHIPLICAKYGVQFYQAIGGMERIIRYKSKLTTEGCDYLVKKLDLTSLAIPPSMESPNLRFLKLPRIPSGFGNKTNQVDVQCLEQDIYQNHDIQTIFDFLDGALYLRISVHIYNTMDDFVRLASVLKKYLDQ
ncbi:hercynylcysteine sulfoxide lyase-like isoform X2 [Pomacea canaliculata]|uniref:hercynylcysteine sulfoxide lyase-like isoform X2 n=1 Tax=Pomacea canaliculata TaxID=400727 RepID=UPI000D73EAAD|nr:hercynylcysteine sulfoxide lyase-like isoform X2 [Pomacea canaliculata]